MADAERRASARLKQPATPLGTDACTFEFFQAVRLLELFDPGGGRLGLDFAPSEEPVRLGALPSLCFPAAQISKLAPSSGPDAGGNASSPLEMTVTFLGLTGPSGVLPLHYTALLIDRCRRQPADLALREFLDIFHHRTLSLFYRAWQKHRFPIGYERHVSAKGRQRPHVDEEPDDLFTFCLRSLVGVGTPGLRGRMSVDDETLLYYSGHFAHFPRSAVALEDLLADFFDTQAEVVQFSGQWVRLAPEDRSRLISGNRLRLQNNKLGETLVLGARMWSPQTKFRVRIGPLSWRRFQDFLPGGSGLRQLTDLARFYAGDQLDFDVQAIVLRDEVPCARLEADRTKAFRLGWNSWSRARKLSRHAEDAVFAGRRG